MHTIIKDGKPVVDCSLEELPIFIVWADCRDMSFDSSEGPIEHTDPTRVRSSEQMLVGFQFRRRPTVTFKVAGVEADVEVKGYPVWTSPRYFLDSEVMSIEVFKGLAKESLTADRYEALEQQLSWQRAHEWAAILVVWIDREKGVWRQYRFEPNMVVLDRNHQVATTMRTKDGERELPTA